MDMDDWSEDLLRDLEGGSLPDPFDLAADEHHNGTALLKEGRDLFNQRDYLAAVARLGQARSAGIPSELVPHYQLMHGAAMHFAGKPDDAVQMLEQGWREHPDFGAFPAFLGLAYFALDRHRDAARALFAAVAGADPDGTLPRYRAALSPAFRRLTRR